VSSRRCPRQGATLEFIFRGVIRFAICNTRGCGGASPDGAISMLSARAVVR
jgi:hypothetical protein